MRATNERGIAMITTLLVMMLVSALLVGFTAIVASDQRYRFIDRDRSQAFYGASAGLEKMTADLGNLFYKNVAPTSAQIQALTTNKPTITGVSYTKADGSSGYEITQVNLGSQTVTQGPYAGLTALVTKYLIDVTARTTAAGEVHLHRDTETVAIPVFQFGVFSDLDLAFHAGPAFNFGGRVHTNGNLFLCEGNGNTLVMQDKVTAYKEVVRQNLMNGLPIGSWGPCTGTVKIATASGACANPANAACRALGYNTPNANGEGSVIGGPTGAANPSWQTISQSYYNSYVKNGKLGAKKLDLPLITLGGSNLDLVKRPDPGEDTAKPTLFAERYYSKASLRILLSDAVAGAAPDITSLPTITATPPVLLDGDWKAAPPTAYGPVDANHPPIARSPGNAQTTTASGSSGSSPNMTINVSSVPTYFRSVISVAGNATNPVTCTGRTSTKFTGCPAPSSSIPIGAAVTAIIDGVTVSGISTTAIWSAAGDITVNQTAAYAPSTLWVGNTLVTCTGNTSVSPWQFTGCTGLAAAPASGVVVGTDAMSSAGTGLIGGYLKIEMQTAGGAWQDVTMEILNYGIGDQNLGGAACANVPGPGPNVNAILKLQRLRDNPTTGGVCNYAQSQRSTDWWPNVLFDTREGNLRDTNPGNVNVTLGGVMHYITLDVGNLSRWFNGVAPYNTGSGVNATSVNEVNRGYTVYFSDRRNNRNQSNQETGEYGFEDFVNPSSGTGAPNGVLDTGEDINGNNALDTYGQFPNYNGLANNPVTGAVSPLDTSARPTTAVAPPIARVNRAILFRRALKLTNGGLGSIVCPGLTPPCPGLTIATENPVYIQGNWNMAAATPPANDGHVATSVIADAVTFLSGGWSDANSFTSPYVSTGRPRTATTYYRVAVIAGKGMAFPNPTGTTADFGNDGGVHNFLRFLEDGAQTLNYMGSIASFYYNRQAVGTFKCSGNCGTVFGPPNRVYNFDLDFLNPALLPPLTPVFRDLNTIAFSQETRPGK